jgi:hypothetical protein
LQSQRNRKLEAVEMVGSVPLNELVLSERPFQQSTNRGEPVALWMPLSQVSPICPAAIRPVWGSSHIQPKTSVKDFDLTVAFTLNGAEFRNYLA